MAANVLASMGFIFFEGLSAIRKGGGIIVAWNKFMNVNVLECNPFVTHVFLQNHDISKGIYVSFVYRLPKLQNRHLLWDWIISNSATIAGSWLLLGDFNQVLNLEDKISCVSGSSGMADFRHCLSVATLQEIRQYGPAFTWSNMRQGLAVLNGFHNFLTLT